MNSNVNRFAWIRVGLCSLAWLATLAGVSLRAAPPTDIALTWTESTPVPEPCDGAGAGVVDGRLVLVGGTYWEGTKGHWIQKKYSAVTYAFSPATQRWEKLSDAPFSVAYPGSTTVGDSLYVIGGLQNEKPGRGVYALSKAGARYAWRTLPELPEARVFPNAVAIGQKIFVVGGTSEYEPFDTHGTCCTSLTARSTTWVLDTAAARPEWKELADHPGELRWLHTAASDGINLWLFGGIYQETKDSPVRKRNEVLRYDVAKNQWTKVASLPDVLQGAHAINAGGKIVLVSSKTDVMTFDPDTSTFAPLSALPRRATIPHFAWIPPFIVGSGGENELEGPRRRSDWTFIGRVNEVAVGQPGKGK
jgi:N-acetylneuraminic acid mutarotase